MDEIWPQSYENFPDPPNERGDTKKEAVSVDDTASFIIRPGMVRGSVIHRRAISYKITSR